MIPFNQRKSTRNRYLYSSSIYLELETLDDEIITEIKFISLTDNRNIPQWKSKGVRSKLKSCIKSDKGLIISKLLYGLHAFDIILWFTKVDTKPRWFSVLHNLLLNIYFQGVNKTLDVTTINDINVAFLGQIHAMHLDEVALVFTLILTRKQRSVKDGVLGGVIAALAWRRKIENQAQSIFSTGRNPPLPNFDDLQSRDYEDEFKMQKHRNRNRTQNNIQSRSPSLPSLPDATSQDITNNNSSNDFFKLQSGYINPKADKRKQKLQQQKDFFTLDSGTVTNDTRINIDYSQNIQTQLSYQPAHSHDIQLNTTLHILECFNGQNISIVGIPAPIFDQMSDDNTNSACLFLSTITAKWLKYHHLDIEVSSDGEIDPNTKKIIYNHFKTLRNTNYIYNELQLLKQQTGVESYNHCIYSDSVEPIIDKSQIDIINHLDQIVDRLFEFGIEHEEFSKLVQLCEDLVLNKTTSPFILHKMMHFYTVKINALDSQIIQYLFFFVDTKLNRTYPRNALDCINLIISIPDLNRKVLDLIKVVQVSLSAINILNTNSAEHKSRMRWELAECLSGRHFWPRHTVVELALDPDTYCLAEIREWCQNEFERNDLSNNPDEITDENYFAILTKLDPAFQQRLLTFFFRGVWKSIKNAISDVDLEVEPILYKIITNLCLDLMNNKDRHCDIYSQYLTSLKPIFQSSLFKPYNVHEKNEMKTGQRILFKCKRPTEWCKAKIMGINLSKQEYVVNVVQHLQGTTSNSFRKVETSSLKILPIL
eukprot:136374_1